MKHFYCYAFLCDSAVGFKLHLMRKFE